VMHGSGAGLFVCQISSEREGRMKMGTHVYLDTRMGEFRWVRFLFFLFQN